MNYRFKFDEKEFCLDEKKFAELVNDEECPVEGINLNIILELLNNSKNIKFQKSYYGDPCDNCESANQKAKFYPFLEYQFYINTKENKFITSSISKENEDLSFNKLTRVGRVDSSYIVFIEVCENCGEFFITIEKVEE